MKPLLSICLITYNHVKYIEQAIESALMQKVDFPFALIIADDCSSDGTRDTLLRYKEKYPELITLILQEKNVGAGQNWLDLINYPASKYIAYFEGDDYWTHPDKLQKQVNFLEANPAYSTCFHYTQALNENGLMDKFYGSHAEKLDFNTEDTFSVTSLFHSSSLVYRRAAFTPPDWLLKVASGDMAQFSVLSAAGPLRCIPEIMSVYRKHESGITQSDKVKNFYHESRIDLLNYLNQFHHFKFDLKARDMIAHHVKQLEIVPKKEKRTGISERVKKYFTK
jgi:glycosyltransferase involved in cell wall biosynthesis